MGLVEDWSCRSEGSREHFHLEFHLVSHLDPISAAEISIHSWAWILSEGLKSLLFMVMMMVVLQVDSLGTSDEEEGDCAA